MINGAAVTGLGRFRLTMARKPQVSGVDMLAIGKDVEVVQHAADGLRHVVRVDTTSREALKQLVVGDLNATVVAIGEDLTASVLAASTLLPLGEPEMWAKAANPQQGEILGQVSIVHMFYPGAETGRRAAHLVAQSFADYMDLDHGFALVITIPDLKCCRVILGKLDVYRCEGFSIVVICGEDGE